MSSPHTDGFTPSSEGCRSRYSTMEEKFGLYFPFCQSTNSTGWSLKYKVNATFSRQLLSDFKAERQAPILAKTWDTRASFCASRKNDTLSAEIVLVSNSLRQAFNETSCI